MLLLWLHISAAGGGFFRALTQLDPLENKTKNSVCLEQKRVLIVLLLLGLAAYVVHPVRKDLTAGDVLWWKLLIVYSTFLARLGGRALGAPGINYHHDNRRLSSDATGRSAAVGAASQAVPICAPLVASPTTILVGGHWMADRKDNELRD